MYSSGLDACIRDRFNQRNITTCVEERKQRFGTSLLRKKGKVWDIQNQEILEDQHSLETKLDIPLNENSCVVFLSSWNRNR